MSDHAGVHVTIADSDSSHVRFLASLNDVDAGVISVRARATDRRFGGLAKSILAGLGKSGEVSGVGRNEQEDTSLAASWLVAHQISDLIVAGIECLPAKALDELVRIGVLCRLDLWLVGDHMVGAHAVSVLENWPTRPLAQQAFDRHWRTRLATQDDRRDSCATDDSGWPSEVPYADFPVYLAEVHRHLTPEHAHLVDQHFRHAHREAVEAIKQVDADELSEETVTHMLQRLLQRCTSQPQIITTARAFQVAAFRAGLFVQVDLSALVASRSHDVAAVVADPNTWRKMRAYRQPYRPTTCLLSGLEVDVATQQKLRVGDVADSGQSVTVEGETHHVPEAAVPLVRAQKLQRLAEGASPTDLLFAAGSSQKPIFYRTLIRAADDAARELGVILNHGRLTRTSVNANQWRQRRGISIQQLVAPREGRAA